MLAGCKLRVVNCKLQIAESKLPIANWAVLGNEPLPLSGIDFSLRIPLDSTGFFQILLDSSGFHWIVEDYLRFFYKCLCLYS